MPVVDGRIELNARVGGVPRGLGDAIPEFGGLQGFGNFAGCPFGQRPFAIGFDGAHEGVRDAHRVVGILARDRRIGLRLPVGVEGGEFDVSIALARELDDALNVILRQLGTAGGHNLAAQPGISLRIEAIGAGRHDGVQVPVGEARAGHQGGHLLLFHHLPGDEFLDVRMVDVDRHHLGGAARRAARLYGACRAIADPEEGHQAGRLATARELLVGAAQGREVRSGAGAIFEEPGFADPEIHDPAFVHQVVRDALDEAGMRLRPLVRRGGEV